MAELESLSFRVDSSQLSDAAKKIAELVTAIQALEASQKTASQVQKETGKLERQALKDAEALVKLKAKLLEAEAKAAAAASGTTAANKQQLSDADKLTNLLGRLNSMYGDLATGNTKWESSILQMARSLNATDVQIQAVRTSLGQIGGLTANPFEGTLGSIRSIEKEMQLLNDRSRLAAQGLYLTTKQLQEYARLGNEIRGQMHSEGIDSKVGAGITEFNRRLAEQQLKYSDLAKQVNDKTAAEKAHNDTLNTQRNILAGIEQDNKGIQESISRNQAITASMQSGTSQTQAGTSYDNSRLIAGAATPEQLTRIQERITLTQKLTESERLLNIEVKAQDDLLKHTEGLVSQRKAIDDLNNSIIANVAERKRMDDLMQKYTGMGLNSSNASELSKLEFKGASQASIDSLKNYLLGIQATNAALEASKRIADEVDGANQKMAQSAAAARYSAAGNSSAIANQAGTMESRGVPASVIATYIHEATAKENAAKASRELANANKFIIDTEERLAAAVNNANQNLNRQSTDELAKYQRALATVGTTTEDTTRKMAALKAQLDLVAGKERQNQLNHLSRAISTQMGDVGISLASGMNPLTVMLQQGDQIRFALQQAGAEGAELQRAMNGAATQIASSIALTFKAMLGFVGGVVTTIGKALATPFTAYQQRATSVNNANMLLRAGFIDAARHARLLQVANLTMAQSFGSLSTVVLGLSAVFSGVLLIALAGVIKREQELSKSIVETGAALGYSKDSAISYASSLNGITTNVAIGAITDFAKAGVRGTESTEKMMLAAIDLEKYGGAAVEATAAAYAKLQGEPMKALQDLAEASGRVTIATLEKAKAYSDAGDRASLLGLAESELARVTEEKAQAMQASMSPIQELWIDIKHAIALAWEEIQNLTRAGPIVDALRVVFQTVAVIATEVYYVIKGIASALAALPAIAGAILSDIKNLDTGATETKRMLDIVNQSSKENSAAYDKAIASIMKTGKAVIAVGGVTTKQLQVNTELARSFGTAAKAEEKYLDSINRLKRERNQLEGQYNKVKGQGKEGTAAGKLLSDAMRNLDQRIKDAEEAKAKKDKGPKGKAPTKSSFSGVASAVSLVDNTSNLQRIYSSELSKQQKFIQSQRDILKLSHEAGLVDKGVFIAKDIKLITEGQSKELSIVSDFGARIKAEHDKVAVAIEARRKDALAANKDSGAAIKINRDAEDQLKKLTETYKVFQETQADKTETVNFLADKRYYESLKEQNSAIIDAQKHLSDLNKAMQDSAEARRIDYEFQWQAMELSGDELASYKARSEALKDYVKLQSKLQGDLASAEKTQADFINNTTFDGQNQEAIERAVQMHRHIQVIKDQITKAGISSELAARNAATDAFNKYYLDKAMEVRDGTANAITEGIMNGGQAGSDAIKSVLNNILKDLLNNVFKQILGSVGDMILKSVMQAQVSSSAASSGGGFLEGLFKTGLSALAGGVGGGSSAPTSNYSFSSGSSISGFRAVGGFVNQGSEYMVGENGPEKFIPKQTGSIVPNHKLADKAASSDPMKVTIINNTSAAIGKVTERQISPTERALVIEEAVSAVASAMYDPNNKVSKSFGQNFNASRRR